MSDTLIATKIHITFLGNFSISLHDKTIINKQTLSKKTWNLIEYLTTYRSQKHTPDNLINALWEDSECSNPGNALKTLLFRARKLLEPLDYPVQDLIMQQKGSYYWTDKLPTVTDVDEFENLCKQISCKTCSAEEILKLGAKALSLYKGDFLQNSKWETWVIPLTEHYHSLYIKLVFQMIDCYNSIENYTAIIDLCHQAICLEPYDEMLHYHLIYALYQSGNQISAIEHYNYAAKMLYDEFAITPSNKFKNLYVKIKDKAHGINTEISSVVDELTDNYSSKGAYYCEYPVFKSIYQRQISTIERNGISAFLCILNLTTKFGNIPSKNELAKRMLLLNQIIISSLRRTDIFCRYSISQYLILIPNTTYENCISICDRFKRRFSKYTEKNDLKISYSLQALSKKSEAQSS